jgi:hypothetical protein
MLSDLANLFVGLGQKFITTMLLNLTDFTVPQIYVFLKFALYFLSLTNRNLLDFAFTAFHL